jgi:hypothetical protein
MKVEERAEGPKVETQNGPTGDAESGPENGGIPTAGADDSQLGAGLMTPPSSGPEVSRRGELETFGQPHGGVGRPAPSEGGPSVAQALGDAPALTRPAGGPSEAQALGDAPALTRPAATFSQGERVEAAPDSEARIQPWIREYYTDERLAEMLERFRAETAERLRQQGCDEEALRWVWPNGPPDQPGPG